MPHATFAFDISARFFFLSLLTTALVACGGTKLLKEPVPLAINQPIASAVDERISVAVDWVIVRDGPGTWARNADWDEYLIRLQNVSEKRVTVDSVAIFDSTLARQTTEVNRRKLVAASRQTARRYANEDIQVRAGLGGGALLAAGAVGGVAAASAGTAALYMSSAAAATTVGVLLAAPALVAGGVVKSLNQGRVSEEIVRRQTVFPVSLEPGETKGIDLFFPLTPSPQKIQISYEVAGEAEQYAVEVDTSKALDGLHLSAE